MIVAAATVPPMTTEVNYGVETAVASLDAAGVLPAIRHVVQQVRRQNADRYEPQLGDDSLTLGFANWRNVTNLLERYFDGDSTIKPVRPDNSFQLLVGPYSVSVYGLSAADPMSVTWRGSGIKMRLAETNSAAAGEEHAEPTLDDVMREQGLDHITLLPTRIAFVHWADADAARIRIWAGFPRNNERGGSPWLQLIEITDTGGGSGNTVDVPD